MDPLTAGTTIAIGYIGDFLKRQGMSYVSDKVKNRQVDLYMKDHIKKACNKTEARFPKLRSDGLNFVLERWCHSDKFTRIFTEYSKNPLSFNEALHVAGFKDSANGYSQTQSIADKAEDILSVFFQQLWDSMLRSQKEGVPLLAAIITAQGGQTNDHLVSIEDKITGISNAISDIPRAVEEAVRMFMAQQERPLDVPLAPTDKENVNVSDEKWRLTIDLALKSSKAVEPEEIITSKSLVHAARTSDDFPNFSPEFKSRIVTVSAICLHAQGNYEAAAEEIALALTITPDSIECLSNAATAALIRMAYPEAIALAQKVRDKEPHHLNAAMVLLQAWENQNMPELVEDFLHTDSWILDSPEGCATIAQIRSRQEQTDEAILLCKYALKEDRESIEALEVLFDAIFHPIREGVMNQEIHSYNRWTKRLMARAEAALNRAVKVLRRRSNKRKLHSILLNRAAVLSAQDKKSAALKDCDEVLNAEPVGDLLDAITLNKASILVSMGDTQSATPLFESLTVPLRIQQGVFGLAYCYYVEGQFDDAIEIWEKNWKPEGVCPSELLVADLLLRAYQEVGKDSKADEVIAKLKQLPEDNYHARAVIAQDEYRRADKVKAVQALRDLASWCELRGAAQGRASVLIQLADLFFHAKQFKEAAKTWDEAGWDNLLPPVRRQYLYALWRDGQNGQALVIAQMIRSEGFNESAAEIESTILSQMARWSESKELLIELARRQPAVLHHQINLCEVALRDKDLDVAGNALSNILYEDIKDDADILRQVSLLHVRLKSKDAIKFAFRAWQIDLGNPLSHRNLFDVFSESTSSLSYDENGQYSETHAAEVIGIRGPKWGTFPCTIQLLPIGVTDERQAQSFTILEDGPFDIPRGIYPPDHKFAQQLLLLKKGDSVSLEEELARHQPPVEDGRLYEVRTYLHPYHHAYQRSMHAAEIFGVAAVGMMGMDIRGNLQEFWQKMDELGRDVRELNSFYAQWGMPLSCFGAARSKSSAEVWSSFAARRQIGIHSEAGTAQAFQETVDQLSLQAPLVVDGMTLVSIVKLGLEELLFANFRIIVSDATYEELLSYQTEIFPNHPVEELLSQVIEFTRSKTERMSPTNTLLFPPADIKKWRRFVGRGELDATLLCLEHSWHLYSDDFVLRQMVKIQPDIKSVHSQSICDFLCKQEAINTVDYCEYMDRMLTFNFKWVMLPPFFVPWQLEKYQYRISDSVRACFRNLEGPSCSKEMAIGVIKRVVEKAWMTPSVPTDRKNDLLLLCLETLSMGHSIGLNAMVRSLGMSLLDENTGRLESIEDYLKIAQIIDDWCRRLTLKDRFFITDEYRLSYKGMSQFLISFGVFPPRKASQFHIAPSDIGTLRLPTLRPFLPPRMPDDHPLSYTDVEQFLLTPSAYSRRRSSRLDTVWSDTSDLRLSRLRPFLPPRIKRGS